MTRSRPVPALAVTVHRLITAVPAPTLELGRTMAGEPYARIRQASRGRGKHRESFLVVAPTFAQLFTALAACFGPDDQPLGE